MKNMIHPETGEILHRDIRPVEFSYKGEKITVEMPGWYPRDNDEGIFSQEDMKVSDAALKYLKSIVEEKTT